MSEQSFYEERAKRETQEVVAAIEAQTSAEIVICLRGASDRYRDTDYLFGFLTSVLVLVAMLFVYRPPQAVTLPLGVIAGFLLGAAASANIAPLRRLMVFPGRKLAAVHLAARGAFHDQGVSRTPERTGILVYISMFERRVEVLPDVGVAARGAGPAWGTAVAALERSLAPRPDVDAFLRALRALGPILGKRLPPIAADGAPPPHDVARAAT